MKKLVLIVAAMGWGLYVVSLFLPAIYEPGVNRVFRGFEALFLSGVALFMIVPHSDGTSLADGLGVFIVSIAMPMSNLAMWVTPRPLFSKQRACGRILPALMLVVSVLNSIGPGVLSQRGDVYIGYYLWVSSFWFVTLALYLNRRTSAPWIRVAPS
jgi:hypothetical protein